MILDATSGKYGWTAVPLEYMPDGITLDARDTTDIVERVKQLWLSGGHYTREQVDAWHYILVPYHSNMIGVVILFEDIQWN